MDAGVSDLDRRARPWARLGAVGLVAFVVVVVAVRVLAAATGEDAGVGAPAGDIPGSTVSLPPASTTTGADRPAAPADADSGVRAGSGVPAAVGLRIYAVDGDELVALDVGTGLVQRSPIDFAGGPDGARHVFASQGRVLVWPVGDVAALAAISVRSGRTGSVGVLAEQVDEVRPGWSLGDVVLRTGGRLGEVAGDGSFRWGPQRPPDGVDGTLLGAVDRRAVLDDGVVGSWGPIDLDQPGPQLVPPDGELVALGADGPIWLASDGTLHLPGFGADVVVDPPQDSGGRWPIGGASVAPNGQLALTLVPDRGPPHLVVLDRAGRPAGGGLAPTELPSALTVIRWAPDSRWVLAADPALQTIVMVRPGTGERFDLGAMPVDEPADYAVVRVSSSGRS